MKKKLARVPVHSFLLKQIDEAPFSLASELKKVKIFVRW
jgi:hypothetical protein